MVNYNVSMNAKTTHKQMNKRKSDEKKKAQDGTKQNTTI